MVEVDYTSVFCITFSVLAAYLRRKSKLRYVSQPTRWQRMERWGPTLKNSMENCRMPPGPPAVLCLRKSFYGQEIGPWPGGGIYIYFCFFHCFSNHFSISFLEQEWDVKKIKEDVQYEDICGYTVACFHELKQFHPYDIRSGRWGREKNSKLM